MIETSKKRIRDIVIGCERLKQRELVTCRSRSPSDLLDSSVFGEACDADIPSDFLNSLLESFPRDNEGLKQHVWEKMTIEKFSNTYGFPHFPHKGVQSRLLNLQRIRISPTLPVKTLSRQASQKRLVNCCLLVGLQLTIKRAFNW